MESQKNLLNTVGVCARGLLGGRPTKPEGRHVDLTFATTGKQPSKLIHK